MHPGQYQLPTQPIYVAPKPTTSGFAVASLTLGIVGLLGGWCLLGIPCLLAVIFGHMALPATRAGRQGGRGAAVAGLALGYVVVVPAVIVTLMGGLGMVLEGAQPKPVATVTGCAVEGAQRTAKVDVAVTNKSSRADSYTVKVSVANADGTRVGDGSAYITDVAPGQTAAGTAMVFLDVPGGSTCSVTSVS